MALFIVIVIFGEIENITKSAFIFLIAIPTLMIVIGFLIFKASVFIIVDEVFDYDDYLLVRQNDCEIQVILKNIQNIKYISGRQLKLMILLKEECPLGNFGVTKVIAKKVSNDFIGGFIYPLLLKKLLLSFYFAY